MSSAHLHLLSAPAILFLLATGCTPPEPADTTDPTDTADTADTADTVDDGSIPIPEVLQGDYPEDTVVQIRGIAGHHANYEGVYLLDPAGGPFSGIWVNNNGLELTVLKGDEVRLTGYVRVSNTLRSLRYLDDPPSEVLSHDNPLPEPNVLTPAEIGEAVNPRQWYSTFSMFEDVTVSEVDADMFVIDSGVGVDTYLHDWTARYQDLAAGDTFSAITGFIHVKSAAPSGWVIHPDEAEHLEGHESAP